MTTSYNAVAVGLVGAAEASAEALEAPALRAPMYVKQANGSHRVHFTQSGTAGEVKSALKATGVKGKELTAEVNAVLRGEKPLRDVLAVAFVQACLAEGFTPDYGMESKNKRTRTLRLVRVGKTAEEELAEARALVASQAAQLAEFKAKLGL